MGWPVGLRFRTSGVRATPGYSIFLLPWAGLKAESSASSRIQGSGLLGGGRTTLGSGIQNDYGEWDLWFDTGTYKIATENFGSTDSGIASIRLNAVEKTTIDTYLGVATSNTYIEVTGIAVTAGLYPFRIQMATKNASSTGYVSRLQSVAWIRTGA